MLLLHQCLLAKLNDFRHLREADFHGLRILAIDKTPLALPEWPALYKYFGAHKTGNSLGTIGVELACLFSIFSRAPIAYVTDKTDSSEDTLLKKLVSKLKKCSGAGHI